MARAKFSKTKKAIKELPDGLREIAITLVNELDFMQDTLGRLKEALAEERLMSETKNGSQSFLKEHPLLKSYATIVQRYSLISKQVTDLLPTGTQKEVVDELMEFIRNGVVNK